MPTAVWRSLSLCKHCPPGSYPDGLLLSASSRPRNKYTYSARDMARSPLFRGRTAGVPERLPPCFVPVDSEEPTGENRGFPARGLLSPPCPIRLTSAAARVNEDDDTRLASPLLPPASINGTFGATARACLTGFCNPHFSVVNDEYPSPRAATGFVI